MCYCPEVVGRANHLCTKTETEFFKKESNFDALPPDLIRAIGIFLLRPEYEEGMRISDVAGNVHTFFGAPKVPEDLAGFEEQSTYVRMALNPLTVPIREEADLYRWKEFKKMAINPITLLTVFAIGMALEAPLALAAAKTASLFNGIPTLAAIGMGIGCELGIHRGLRSFKMPWHNLTDEVICPILAGIALATLGGRDPVAAFITALVALPSGVLTGTVIKPGVNKIFSRYSNASIFIPLKLPLRAYSNYVLPAGMGAAAFLVAAYVFWNNPFGAS